MKAASAETQPPVPISLIRTTLGVCASALVVCCIALFAGAPKVLLHFGHYPRTYLAFAAVTVVALVAAVVGYILVPRIAGNLVRVLRAVDERNGTLALSAGILAFALFAWQFEAWLIPGYFLSVGALLAAASGIILVLTAAGYRIPSLFAIARLPRSVATLLLDVSGSGLVLAVLIAMIVIRTAVVLYYAATTPLLCDEASTVELYATSLGTALTRYDTPNNHIVNSALVSISTAMCGPGLLAIRVFAICAGALSPLAVFVLAGRLFGPRVALLAAVFESVSLWVLTYSFQARAYAFISLLTPIAISSLFYAWEAPNSFRRWRPFTVACSILVITIPTAIYLLAALVLCSVLATITPSASTNRKGLSWRSREVVWSWAFITLFAVAVYLNPVFYLRRMGLGSGVFHGFLQQPQSIPSLASETLDELILGRLPPLNTGGYEAFGWVLAFLAVLGVGMLIYYRRHSALVVTASLLVAPLFVIAAQPDLPFARHLSFLLTWVHVLAAVSLTGLISLVSWSSKTGVAERVLWPVALLLLFGAAFWQSRIYLSVYLRANRDLMPAAALSDWLIENTTAGDAVICDTCLDYMIQYRIGSRRRITTVLEWWVTGTPSGSHVIAIPFRGGPSERAFLARVCGGFGPAQKVMSFGLQNVYRCK